MVEIDLLSIAVGALFGAIFSAVVSSYIRYVNRPRIDMKLVITGINNVDLEDGLPLDKGGILKLKVINHGRTSTKNLTVSIRSMCKLGMVSIHIGSLHPNQIASFGVGTFEGDKIVLYWGSKEKKAELFNSGIVIDRLPEILEFTAFENDMQGIRHLYLIREDLIIDDLLDSDIPISDGTGEFYGSIPVSEHIEPRYVEVTDPDEIKEYHRQMKKRERDDW